MFLNYLKVTLRNMMRNRLFTAINIIGLSISLACCILLFFYTTRELNYDKYQDGQVYRVTSLLNQKDGQIFNLATSSVPIAHTIDKEVPEIMTAARATSGDLFGGKSQIRYKDDSWYINDGYFVDTAIFDILKFNIIEGNQKHPLSHLNGIVLEKHWAKVIFGNDDPIGKTVQIGTIVGKSDFEVTAVYDAKTYDTHFAPNYFVSMSHSTWDNFFNKENTNWVGNNTVFTYIKLVPEADPKAVEKKINAILLKNGGSTMKAMGVTKTMALQPVAEIHTAQGYIVNVPGTISLTFIHVLITIGILILILACVNYINLSTAQAGKRSLEVGVRKVMGVTPRGLIGQFLSESFIIVLCSLILSIFIVDLILPYFNQLLDRPLIFSPGSYGLLAGYLLLFLIVTGIVAGFYPAFYLSSFQPNEVLKGKRRDSGGPALLRKGLVVFQFVISIALISAIIVITKQVNFIKNTDLGFNPNTKLVIPLSSDESGNKYDVLKQKFSGIAMVKEVSGTSNIPGSLITNDDLFIYKKGQTMDDAVHIYNGTVDLEYLQMMGMKTLGGSFFKSYNKDTLMDKILISETAAKALGWTPDQCVGQVVYFDWQGKTYRYEIMGVVNDYHQMSLHEGIDPTMFTIGNGRQYRYIVLNANFNNFQALLGALKKQWKEVVPNAPFEYYTLNDHLLQQYQSDFNTFNLIKYFAFISLLISCLGLYAMSMFFAEKRFREIGIRKAFGASVNNILVLMSGDLYKLVAVAFLLSIPISIYAMNKWLDTFAYRISLGISTYIWAGLISLLIAWLTISYQSFRAAKTNPIDVLRDI